MLYIRIFVFYYLKNATIIKIQIFMLKYKGVVTLIKFVGKNNPEKKIQLSQYVNCPRGVAKAPSNRSGFKVYPTTVSRPVPTD